MIRSVVLGALLTVTTVSSSSGAQAPRNLTDRVLDDTLTLRCLSRRTTTGPVSSDEPFVATNPVNQQQVVAVWQNRRPGGSVMTWSRSDDGGKSWSQPRAAPINACANGPVRDADRVSDPWVAFGPDGRLYITGLAFHVDTSGNITDPKILVVVASPDGGRSWEAPVVAATAPAGHDYDNLAIAVDARRPKTLYLATTAMRSPDSATFYGQLGFSRSSDGGRTWTTLRTINPPVNGERIGAPQILAHPSGAIFALFHRRLRGQGSVEVLKSTDQGNSWGAPVVVAAHSGMPTVRIDSASGPFVLADDIVQGAISPSSGAIFVAYTDAHRDPRVRTDVSLVWSLDGASWSQPMVLSDRATAAWLPGVATNPSGEIAVTYMASNFGVKDGQSQVHLRQFRLASGTLVELGKAEIDQAPRAWPGDYQGLAAAAEGWVPVWGRQKGIAARLIPFSR